MYKPRVMKVYKITLSLGCLLVLLGTNSCDKWIDEKAPDIGLDKKYCNIPDAVNYNWNFPGIADSSVCYYPADVFKGDFILYDTIRGNNDSFISAQTRQLHIEADGKEKIIIGGFCDNTGNLYFTANRYLRAVSDTTLANEGGQLICRETDTLFGEISRIINTDTFSINFTVYNDTGTIRHKGVFYKN